MYYNFTINGFEQKIRLQEDRLTSLLSNMNSDVRLQLATKKICTYLRRIEDFLHNDPFRITFLLDRNYFVSYRNNIIVWFYNNISIFVQKWKNLATKKLIWEDWGIMFWFFWDAPKLDPIWTWKHQSSHKSVFSPFFILFKGTQNFHFSEQKLN